MAHLLKNCKLYFFITLLFLINSVVLHAQTLPALSKPQGGKRGTFDSLLNRYGAMYRSPALYIHFDKNVYANNETIWFTGYLLGEERGLSYNTLSLALIKDDDRSVLMNDRFVITNGFCFGNTTIPDSVNAGAYTLIAYGNRVAGSTPDVVFTQQITIKTGNQPTFNASLNPLDTSATAANQKVMLLVGFIDPKSAPKSVQIKYHVGDARKPVTTGAVKTTNGQYIFSIPSAILTATNNKLHVQVKHKTEIHDLSIALPVAPQPAQVHFYPEGGNIVSGMVNTVGWEIANAYGKPMFANAVLYEDKQALDTLHNNESGLGRFVFIAQKNKRYYLKLLGKKNDNIYNLPDAVNGPSVTVKRAVVNDTLLVEVHNNIPQRRLYLVGHNFKQTFFETAIQNKAAQRLKIILNDVPRGLLQLTLVDSLGRPYAERMVFAHYPNASKLEITTDNDSYAKRKKVKLNIKLTGKADNAAVSVAVVQANRVEMRNKNDVESYIHLRQHVGDLPLKENYFSNSDFDKRDMEDLLLIKGWRRYKWTDVLKADQKDTVLNSTELILAGKVTRLAGKFKTPVTLLTLNPGVMYETDMNGNFTLPDSNIITEPNKTIGMMVANGDLSNYQVSVINPFDSINKHLALKINPVEFYAINQEGSADSHIPGLERAIRLNEVVIKDNKDNSFYGGRNNQIEMVFFPCGDYVCLNGIVNCPNHRPPGCDIKIPKAQIPKPKPVLLNFKGVYAAQEFYPLDFSEVNPSQPEYLSTIYWKNQLLLKKGEAQEISFYTSDITGPFKVIVQGITNTDVIYAESTFRVIK